MEKELIALIECLFKILADVPRRPNSGTSGQTIEAMLNNTTLYGISEYEITELRIRYYDLINNHNPSIERIQDV